MGIYKETKDVNLQIRLTKTESKKLKKLADNVGKKVACYVRDLIFKA